MIDLDDALLDGVAQALGTSTKEETVIAALREVLNNQRRALALARLRGAAAFDLEPCMTAEPLPDWFSAPPGGWTADDMDRLPAVAPRLELIDGALIVRSLQTTFHSRVARRLANALEVVAPTEVSVDIEISVKLGRRQRPEPDVLVYRRPAEDPEKLRTFYEPSEVLLVIEIVSDESEERDRKTKPQRYAEAGIQHFWRVEKESGLPVIHVFELEQATGSYVATGIVRDRLKLDVPFPLDIDVKALSQ